MVQSAPQTALGLCEGFTKGPPETVTTLVTFIVVYCYDCSVLLVIVVNLLILPSL